MPNPDIRDFGAAGDERTLNTGALQKAIDTGGAAGGGRERGTGLVDAHDASRVGITGTGKIDGQSGLFRDKENRRPFLLRFAGTTDITLEGVELHQSAAWTCHFYQRSGVRMNNPGLSGQFSRRDSSYVICCELLHRRFPYRMSKRQERAGSV